MASTTRVIGVISLILGCHDKEFWTDYKKRPGESHICLILGSNLSLPQSPRRLRDITANSLPSATITPHAGVGSDGGCGSRRRGRRWSGLWGGCWGKGDI